MSTSGTTSNDCDQIDDIENDAEEPEHYLEEMHLWDSYGLSHSLLKGLKELGFTQPTQIQALTLPPAILGKLILFITKQFDKYNKVCINIVFFVSM